LQLQPIEGLHLLGDATPRFGRKLRESCL
jgi:hypothetical protein